jgi:hypothetical protein
LEHWRNITGYHEKNNGEHLVPEWVLDLKDQWNGKSLRNVQIIPLVCFPTSLLPQILRQKEEDLIKALRPDYNRRCNEVKWTKSQQTTVPQEAVNQQALSQQQQTMATFRSRVKRKRVPEPSELAVLSSQPAPLALVHQEANKEDPASIAQKRSRGRKRSSNDVQTGHRTNQVGRRKRGRLEKEESAEIIPVPISTEPPAGRVLRSGRILPN